MISVREPNLADKDGMGGEIYIQRLIVAMEGELEGMMDLRYT